jgi:hypothetical protein
MIILDRFCIFALHLSLAIHIASQSALAASARPNLARTNGPDDLLLPNLDGLSYQLNPGLFKRIPQEVSSRF